MIGRIENAKTAIGAERGANIAKNFKRKFMLGLNELTTAGSFSASSSIPGFVLVRVGLGLSLRGRGFSVCFALLLISALPTSLKAIRSTT
jgi:hypothetical protein